MAAWKWFAGAVAAWKWLAGAVAAFKKFAIEVNFNQAVNGLSVYGAEWIVKNMLWTKPGNGEQVRWRRGRQRWQQPDRRRGPGISIDCGIGIAIGIGIDKKYYPCSSLKQKIILQYWNPFATPHSKTKAFHWKMTHQCIDKSVGAFLQTERASACKGHTIVVPLVLKSITLTLAKNNFFWHYWNALMSLWENS